MVRAAEDGGREYITLIQRPCSAILPLTIYQSDMIENEIHDRSSAISVSFWQEIGHSSLPCFDVHTFHINGAVIRARETIILQSLVEFNGL